MSRREPEPATEGAGTDPSSTAPSTPDALYETGFRHLQTGRLLDAQNCCQQALAMDPGHADSLQLMGLLSLHAGHYDHAVEWLARAIRQNPKSEYLSTLGFTLKQIGRLDEALKVFDKAVQLSPDDAELWKQLGGVLAALDRPTEALASYQHALQLNPRHREAAYQSGVLLYQLERFADALDRLNLCDELRGAHAPTLQMRARVLRALKRYEECLADDLRAHALDPTAAITCNNIGDALLWLGRHQEGLEWFDKALELQPDFVDVLFNKGFALLQLNRFDEAGDIYRRLKALDPNDGKAGWQLAHLQLLTGDFEAGWAEREARWKVPDFSPDYPKLTQPKWLGEESVAGRTVLVHVDEGLGDAIQFARYVPMLAARGARIILVVQEALCPLLSGLPGVAACLPFPAGRLPAFDMHCPITSLPLAFRTTLATIPPANYLPPLPPGRVQAWKQRLGPHCRFRVGLVWSGNPKQGDDRHRSMRFETMTPLLELGATFVSLQKDLRTEDKPTLIERTDIVDCTAELTDFVETAALIANLDLVITVCTSVAHLSATLRRPTWIMLPYVGDWRWLLDRNDSPWYPTVRLFRQDETRDYAGVIARVRGELVARISAFESGKIQNV